MAHTIPTSALLLLFRLAGKVCALRLESVSEIVPIPRLDCPPGMPDILAGFLNLGGRSIPVVQPERLFTLPTPALGLFTPVVILNLGSFSLALIVEQVTDVLTVPATATSIALEPENSLNGCVQAVLTIADQTIHVLNADRILLEKERHCISSLQAVEQSRLRRLPSQEAIA